MRAAAPFLVSLALVVAMALPGCGSPQGEPVCPPPAAGDEPAGESPERAGPGHLDAELMGLAARAPQVDRIRLRVDESGDVIKLAVYHHDEGAIPEAVRQAAEERFPGAEVRHYESELYADIGRVFEVEVTTAEGRNCELSARGDGSFVYVEREISVDEVPPPVAEAVTRLVPDGEIVEAATKEGPARNAVHLEVRAGDGRMHYLVLAPGGELRGHYLRIPATIDVPVP